MSLTWTYLEDLNNNNLAYGIHDKRVYQEMLDNMARCLSPLVLIGVVDSGFLYNDVDDYIKGSLTGVYSIQDTANIWDRVHQMVRELFTDDGYGSTWLWCNRGADITSMSGHTHSSRLFAWQDFYGASPLLSYKRYESDPFTLSGNDGSRPLLRGDCISTNILYALKNMLDKMAENGIVHMSRSNIDYDQRGYDRVNVLDSSSFLYDYPTVDDVPTYTDWIDGDYTGIVGYDLEPFIEVDMPSGYYQLTAYIDGIAYISVDGDSTERIAVDVKINGSNYSNVGLTSDYPVRWELYQPGVSFSNNLNDLENIYPYDGDTLYKAGYGDLSGSNVTFAEPFLYFDFDNPDNLSIKGLTGYDMEEFLFIDPTPEFTATVGKGWVEKPPTAPDLDVRGSTDPDNFWHHRLKVN